MKKSIAFLPKKNREDLKYLVSLIRERISQCEMIILFGSYARGTFVDYDERIEFGIPTTFKSDYDILVVHSAGNSDVVDTRLSSARTKYGYWGDARYRVPVQFIHDNIKKVNKDLENGRYFYTELKRDGILLYDSGNYKLARRRKLKFDEIKEYAEGYYAEKMDRAALFYKKAEYMFGMGEYSMSCFDLHQDYENLFHTIALVYTLKSVKEHNLEELYKATRGYAPELYELFPLENEEEERLFKILVRSYVEARYNPKFTVEKEDVEKLMEKAEKLKEVVKIACDRRIKEYAEKVKK